MCQQKPVPKIRKKEAKKKKKSIWKAVKIILERAVNHIFRQPRYVS